MRLEGLMKPIRESDKFKNIMNEIFKGRFPVGVYGLSESARSYLIYGVFEALDSPVLIVTHSDVDVISALI